MSNNLVAYLPHHPDSKEQNKHLEFCKTSNGSKENYEIPQGHQGHEAKNKLDSFSKSLLHVRCFGILALYFQN